MKNIKIVIPVFIVLVFASFLYINIAKNRANAKVEEELVKLRIFSNEIKESYVENNIALKELNVKTNNDIFVLSNKHFQRDMEAYLKILADSDFEQFNSLYKILKDKVSVLNNTYEDIKTDTADLKNSVIWAKIAYKKYMNNKKKLSEDDRSYLEHLFSVTIGSTTNTLEDFKYITSLENVELLNKHLKMIYTKKRSLSDLYNILEHNDLRPEINKVIKYSHEVASKLHKDNAKIVSNLLYMALVMLVLAIVVYVKEYKNARALMKAKNELDDFFLALNESSIVSKTDLAGKITYVNDKFCEISGYSREELLGKPHNIIRHPSMDSSVFKELWDTIQAGKIFKGIIRNRKKDGSMYIVDTTIIPLHDEDGNIVEYLAVRYDLTHTLHMVL
ncbi:diguanylate cyclase/phosphodiesterase (GGDEF & EAL domains) with PAS/PAC sensor(s) [hydrothermal vent metagenome]|uniref:Diguanylate cyclase/phosphodiesterase (GGDEF & EAL domains) with PAS/PAC sensor(S) n=1 Tax=hydrothermal vent metagenome TaxID=652676 RepID=A0A1W1D5Q8_9ZZZZ